MPPRRGDRVRVRLANVLLPGAGLVSQDRVALGAALGLACWLPLTAAAYVAWLEPAALPIWAVAALTGVAVVAYLAGQVILVRLLNGQARRQADYLAATVPALRAAYEAMAAGSLLQAQLHLDTVLACDGENFEACLVQARLLAAQNKFDKARSAYARCRRLDPAGRWRWEIDRELAAIPAAG